MFCSKSSNCVLYATVFLQSYSAGFEDQELERPHRRDKGLFKLTEAAEHHMVCRVASVLCKGQVSSNDRPFNFWCIARSTNCPALLDSSPAALTVPCLILQLSMSTLLQVRLDYHALYRRKFQVYELRFITFNQPVLTFLKLPNKRGG